jgi:calcineurin-like phosphoesterase
LWNNDSQAQLSIVNVKERIMKKSYVTAVLTLACVFGLGGSALARDHAHSVDINEAVQIGTTTLKPGNYKVDWQGTGPEVQVTFAQFGKIVATVPGTLKTNDDPFRQDATVTQATSTGTSLKELDFHRQKEAIVFDQSIAGMTGGM